MGAALRFKHVNVPRQQGEQARLKVVQGPDYGAVFVITGERTTLGRGEENDIMVSDLKASRKHAEFTSGPGGWQVKDMGSANGLLHNGKVTRLTKIQSGDTVTFGETTLEFITSEVGTMMLVAPPRSASVLQAERQALDDQRKRVRSFGSGQGSGASGAQDSLTSPKTLLYMAVGGMALWLFLGDSTPPVKKESSKKNPAAQSEDLSKYLPGSSLDPATERTAEQFFKAGFREFLTGNYLRAKTQFETVLQMAPGHPLATLYLENCENAIKDEITFHIDQGKTSTEAGKLKEAKAHYEAVLRILFHDQSNPSYTEAKDQLDKVLKQLSGHEEGGK